VFLTILRRVVTCIGLTGREDPAQDSLIVGLLGAPKIAVESTPKTQTTGWATAGAIRAGVTMRVLALGFRLILTMDRNGFSQFLADTGSTPFHHLANFIVPN
jgi:hypothetical protein